MQTDVVVTIEAKGGRTIDGRYGGTDISRYWKDPYLKKVLLDAAERTDDTNDAFDYCNLIFSYADNLIKRRYGGRNVQLKSVTVYTVDTEVTSYQ